MRQGLGVFSVIFALGCGADRDLGGSDAAARGGSTAAAAGSQAAGSAALAGGANGSAGANATAAGHAGREMASAGSTSTVTTGGRSGSGGRTGGAGSAGRSMTAGASGASGAGSGGSAACDWPDPPSDVSAWVNESWNAQLGPNIKNRKAWNLDNVMLNKGELNLCVRWGATSAVPETVRTNLAATIERWFNDWFKGLDGYGCFPYGAGIKVRVTGWAVKPGQQALLSGIDPAIPVYTETDADGEPKCPDDCSSFVHWDHQFPSCPGGAANHSDYWLWFDDKLPGNGGAEAVGGDWGLRMPVSTFVGAFAKQSYMVCEHEMGHGFGMQDYYDWTGSKPTGGSIMIVGSTQSQVPTTADVWLLRRTWKEMKTLRGW